jgi:transcriptional regulator with XRE-family HTH domain
MRSRTTQDLIQSLLAAGDTQAVIADGTGLTQPTICRLASGEHKNPSVDTHNRVVAYAMKRLRTSKKTAA